MFDQYLFAHSRTDHKDQFTGSFIILAFLEQKRRPETYFPATSRLTGQSLELSRVWPIIRLVLMNWRKLHFQNFYDFRTRKNFFEIILYCQIEEVC